MTGPPPEVVVGIDVGTTAAKVSAFGVRAGMPWRHTVVREYPLHHPEPAWAIQEPAVVLAAAEGALAQCVADVGAERVIGLALSTAMHGVVGLDARGEPLTPIITWADGRSRSQAQRLRASGQGEALLRASGTPMYAAAPLTKLMWFAEHDPALCSRVATWAGLKDLLVHHLTGALVTELSSASSTGLLSLATLAWNPEALDLARVRPGQLPPIRRTTDAVPLAAGVASRVGLPAGMPVVLGAGDGPLGTLGSGAIDAGVLGVSIGTSAAARLLVPGPWSDPAGRLFCYALTDDEWVVGGAVSNGGSVLRWIGELCGEMSDDALVAAAADVPPGAEGLVMLPFLLSERSPLVDEDQPGALLGLRSRHGPGHLARAAVEGICLHLAAVVADLNRVSSVESLRVTGGVFRSTLWRDVLAACVDRPVAVSDGPEGSALGAAALGLVGLGRATTPREGLDLLGGSPGGDDVSYRAGEVSVTAYRALQSRLPELTAAYAVLADTLVPHHSGS